MKYPIAIGLIAVIPNSAPAVAQTVIHVDDDASLGGDGLTWDTAFTYLQDALSAAEGDPAVSEIRVAGGTYWPDLDEGGLVEEGDRTATFQLLDNLELRGGYRGCPAADCQGGDPDDRDIGLYETVLSGDLNGDDHPVWSINRGDNSHHIVTGSGTNATAILDGLAITAGNARDISPNPRGGGMYNDSGNPTLTNCTFSRNWADLGGAMFNNSGSPTLTECSFITNAARHGGAMFNDSSDPRLTTCLFTDNDGDEGGGMFNASGNPTLANCTFSENFASYGAGIFNYVESSPTLTDCTFSGNSAWYGKGGGMYNDTQSSPTLTNCTFTGNSASDGGGMYNFDSSPTLANCTFSEHLLPYDADGGGMYNIDSNPTLANCSFSENSAGRGGGMYNTQLSSPRLTNCSFSGNMAVGSYATGGGVYNQSGSSPMVANCTFSGNSGSQGGGMYNYDNSRPALANCAFSGNVADIGGGMYNHGVSSPSLANCILWGNTASTGPQIHDDDTGATTATYSCIQGGWMGAGNIDGNPFLDSALRPVAGSPCIDAGISVAISVLDLDGNQRIVDHPATPDTGLGFPEVIDMGPYEYGSTPPGPSSADIDGDGDVDLDDFMLFQQQFSGPQR